MKHSTLDERLMRRCLDLASRAEGRTSPNPMVGAVVARGGRVLAEAFHRRAGSPHAEVLALRRAGGAARGSTLYVNLEPCSHYGRTPPCVDAILASGVRRVVAAMRDPFHRVNGRGFAALRRSGVEVRVGLLRAEAALLNEKYLTWIDRGRPFVLVKAAMSLDGKIAPADGVSRWISSASSRALAHRLRASHDAVLIGGRTAVADDPSLTARRGERLARHQPLRVIMDGRLRVSPRARIFNQRGGGPVIVYTTTRAATARARRLEGAGAEVVRLAAGRGGAAGRPRIEAVLSDLADRGVTSVMIEGGGEIIAAALAAGVVDKVSLFAAPKLVGGRRAVPLVSGRGARSLSGAVRLRDLSARRVGPDLHIEGYVAGGPPGEKR